MNAESVAELCQDLDVRRRKLRMSYAVLAKQCHVSQSSVIRALSGQSRNISFGTMVAIATALGMKLSFEPACSVVERLEHQAEKRAAQLVGMVQGTSGLEAQALDEDEICDMQRKTVHELLAGSPRRLWGD